MDLGDVAVEGLVDNDASKSLDLEKKKRFEGVKGLSEKKGD